MAYGYTPEGQISFRLLCNKLPDFDVNFAEQEWDKLHSTRAAIKKALNESLDTITAEKRAFTDREQKGFDYGSELIKHIGDEIEARLSYDDKRPRHGTEGWGQRARHANGSNGKSESTVWRSGKKNGATAHVLRPDERVASVVQDHGVAEVGFGHLIRAMVLGAQNEAEERALSEGTDSAGGFTVPVHTVASFIDRLRARSTAIRAGARTVVLDTDKTKIARLTGDPTASWKLENALASDSDPSFDSVTFDAQSLVSVVKVSRELMEDSVNINDALTNAFAQVLSGELDRVALLGSGTAPEPRGIANTSGVGSISMGVNGGAITSYDSLLDALQTLQNANALDPTAAIMAPRTATAIAKLKDTTNQPLRRPEALVNLPFLQTTRIPINETQGTATNASRIIVGNYAELMIGMRTSLRIEILKERYAEYLQYGFLAYLRADVQLVHPASFCQVVGVIP